MTLFEQIKEQLQYQFSREQFNQLFGATTADEQGDTLTIHAGSDSAREWLENRLHPLLAKTAARLSGRPIQICYNGSEPPTSEIPRFAAPIAIDPAESLAHFDQLARNWTKHPRYLSLYYQPYFSTFNRFAGSRAMTVWQFIRDRLDDKKYDQAWTPVWEVLLKDLARLTRCTSQQLTGCWRPCPVFDRALNETGEVIECCGRYGYPGNRELPGERPMCRYWSAGVFQLLAEHGLATVKQIGTAARNTRFAVQIYRWPPLLTPWQASRFSDEAQQAHARFLADLGIDLEEWRRVETVSLMRIWFDRSGLVLDDGVLNAIAFKNFFLPAV